MASPLESAITLEDVFAMVTGKRVPLAPELAGYLSLEIAEKADSARASGDVDPRSVYIADEGTVALVLPRGEAQGDVEQSIRAILGQLLEASGSSTAALSNVARRASSAGLRGLMEDLEAALIPVNRAAGRRALARLAREVKRVTHGVGRNAPTDRSASGERVARASRPDSSRGSDPAHRPVARSSPKIPAVPQQAPRAPAPATPHPRPVAVPTPPPLPPAPAMFDNPSDVDSLLEQFSQSTSPSEQAVSRELKGLVDIGETAAPPLVGFPPPTRPGSDRPTALPASVPPTSLPHSGPTSGAGDVDDLLALVAPEDEAMPGSRIPTPVPASAAARGRSSTLRPAIEQPRERPREKPPERPAEKPPEKATTPPPREVAPREPARALTPNPRDLPTNQSIPIPSWAKPKKKRTDYWIILAIVGVLAAGGVTAWLFNFKPGFLSGRTAERVAAEKAANEALRQKMAANQAVLLCHSAIDVSDVPNGAEVLLRVGQAPVDVPHLPVGTRLEFVATADGFAPKRVVVPANATWDNGADGKPRFELAVELAKSNPKAKLGDPWPPAEPGSEVGGKGPPGTVHIVSTPRGAEMWMLAGLGPEALIEQLPCEQSVEVLVAGPTTFRKRLKAVAADFTPRPGEANSKIAKLSAK